MKRKFCVALLLVSLFVVNTIAFAQSKGYSSVGVPQYSYGAVTVVSNVTRSINANNARNTCTANLIGAQCYCAVRNTSAITGVNGNQIAAGTLIVTGKYFTTGSVNMPYMANAKTNNSYLTYMRVENQANQGTNISGTYDADYIN